VFDGFGKRHTSADLLEAGNPKNLIVLVNATVKSIIFHHNGKNHNYDFGYIYNTDTSYLKHVQSTTCVSV
jgi:hypothetical protein